MNSWSTYILKISSPSFLMVIIDSLGRTWDVILRVCQMHNSCCIWKRARVNICFLEKYSYSSSPLTFDGCFALHFPCCNSWRLQPPGKNQSISFPLNPCWSHIMFSRRIWSRNFNYTPAFANSSWLQTALFWNKK